MSDLTPSAKTRSPSRLLHRCLGLALLLIAAGSVSAAFLVTGGSALQGTAPVYDVEIVNTFPHDPRAFSQGLVVEGDVLLEGTGQYRESTLREVDLKTGKVKRRVRLADSVFGEGITVFQGRIYQLTWKRGLCYVYDRKTMKYQKTLRYSGEGWGLTHNGKHLIMSDGTPTLRFLDPQTLRVLKRVRVRDGRKQIWDVNELEYINGEIFANIWHLDQIARIDPETGRVKSWLDLRAIRPDAVRFNTEAALNGIAWDADRKRLFVTGKDWPSLFEIRISAQPRP